MKLNSPNSRLTAITSGLVKNGSSIHRVRCENIPVLHAFIAGCRLLDALLLLCCFMPLLSKHAASSDPGVIILVRATVNHLHTVFPGPGRLPDLKFM